MEDLRWCLSQVDPVAGALKLKVCFQQVIHLPCTTAHPLSVGSSTLLMQL